MTTIATTARAGALAGSGTTTVADVQPATAGGASAPAFDAHLADALASRDERRVSERDRRVSGGPAPTDRSNLLRSDRSGRDGRIDRPGRPDSAVRTARAARAADERSDERAEGTDDDGNSAGDTRRTGRARRAAGGERDVEAAPPPQASAAAVVANTPGVTGVMGGAPSEVDGGDPASVAIPVAVAVAVPSAETMPGGDATPILTAEDRAVTLLATGPSLTPDPAISATDPIGDVEPPLAAAQAVIDGATNAAPAGDARVPAASGAAAADRDVIAAHSDLPAAPAPLDPAEASSASAGTVAQLAGVEDGLAGEHDLAGIAGATVPGSPIARPAGAGAAAPALVDPALASAAPAAAGASGAAGAAGADTGPSGRHDDDPRRSDQPGTRPVEGPNGARATSSTDESPATSATEGSASTEPAVQRPSRPLIGRVDTRRLDVDLGDEGLGPLRLQTTTHAGALHVSLQAADPQVRDAILRQSYELRRDLESSGIHLGSFDVGGQQHGAGHGAGGPGEHGSSSRSGRGDATPHAGRSAPPTPTSVTDPTTRRRPAASGLDLKL